MKKPCISFYLTAVLLAALVTTPAKAQDFLITINDADPSAVTFTATGNAPTVADATHLYSQGITFANFVTTSTLIPAFNATSAGLVTGANGTPDYNRTQSGSITGTFDDLQLYSNGSGATENFDLGTAAFAGTSTFDFSAYASVLPANATTGLIYAGSGDIFTATPVVIGSYQVIQAAAPEPRQWALMLVGGLALVLVCRFRGSSQGVVQG